MNTQNIITIVFAVLGLAAMLVAGWALTQNTSAPPPPPQVLAPVASVELEVAGHEPAGAVPWTGVLTQDRPEDFSFLVVTDRTGGHREGVFARAMRKINLLKPDFVVSVGDLIEGYTDDPQVLKREWRELESFVEQLEMPFFYAAGNHDMSNELMAEEWRGRFGPSYYHFRYRDVLFLVMNSELFGMVHNPQQSLPGPWTLERQMQYAEQALADNADARWTVVLVHQPLWDAAQIHPEWLRFEQMIQHRPHTVFAGHQHAYTLHRRHDRNYITLATTGGGSELRGPIWGEFDQVAVVRMGAQGPTIANVEIDGIHPVDVRTVERRAVVDKLTRAVQVLSPPVKNAQIRRGIAEFEIVNPLDTALKYRAKFEVSGAYELEDTLLSGDLAAGEQRILQMPFDSSPAVQIGNAPALRTAFELEADDDTAPAPIRLSLKRTWLPEHLFRIARASRPLQVDGMALEKEWRQLSLGTAGDPYVSGAERHEGAHDLSFAFDVRLGEQYLYLFVAVTDDSIVSSEQRIARQQDMVQITLDSRPEPELLRNYASLSEAAAQGGLAQMMLPMIPVGEAAPDPTLATFGVHPPEGLLHAVRRTDDGYSAEIAIPVERLNERSGGQWSRLRLNVSVLDFDEGEPNYTQVFWRPPRYEAGTAVNSGLFEPR